MSCFKTDQVGATDIVTFYRKVPTKADNTIGIMIFISDYAAVAIRESSSDHIPLLLLNHYKELSFAASYGKLTPNRDLRWKIEYRY